MLKKRTSNEFSLAIERRTKITSAAFKAGRNNKKHTMSHAQRS